MTCRSLFRTANPDEPLEAADCVFVFAGMPERKRYGLDLWRRGLAPTLILSVGRFEWRRFRSLGLADDGGLGDLVAATAPVRRHFFVTLGPAGARSERIVRRRLGTRSEALALRGVVDREGYRSVLVVSTSVHLRRVALTLRRIFRGRQVRFAFAAVPEERSSIREARWWRSSGSLRFVLTEMVKLFLYFLFVWR